MLEVENLTKWYRKKIALNSVNFKAENGIYGLLGPNGAGKTTLMRIIVGLIKPNSGRVIFNGKDVLENIEEFRYKIGYLPQEFGCFKHITIIEFLNIISILKGINNKTVRERQIEEILYDVNLYNDSSKKVGALSGGMKRRLGIAQSILGNPSLVIVDEPTAGLDPEERIRFRGLIRKMSTNRLILLSTHIIEDIKNNCDGVALIKNGIIKQVNNFKSLEELANCKVWAKTIAPNEFEKYEQKYNILSSNKIDNKLIIRLYSDEKPNGANLVEPTAEEGYLSWIKK